MPIEEDKEVIQGESPPLRLQTGQRSYNGLNVIAGRIYEECNADLRWPGCIETYKKMAKDATVAPALQLLEMYIAKVDWKVKIPEGYEEQLEDKAEFLKSVMDDMEHSWTDFIKEAATINRYGFAPIEKVYRKRTRKNGSKHNDGLYGLKSLPLIAQDSIDSWTWSADGRKLTGLVQAVNIPTGKDKIQTFRRDFITIPKKKFILFRADPQKDNPVGTSPLNSVYVAWRFKTEIEKFESVSISQDLRGMKVIKVPPRYLDANASEDDKKTAEYFREILRSLHRGEQSGVLLPQAYDEQGKPLFEFNVVSVMGNAAHDLDKIISRYRTEIVTGLLNPQLILGQGGSGSFALADALGKVTNTVIQARLREIRDQLNHDLIPQLWQLNGWDTSVTPYFEFNDVDSFNIDDLSKFIQRVAAAGLIKVDAETVNWIAAQVGMPTPFDVDPENDEELRSKLTGFTSNAGEGMEIGTTGDGTAKSLSPTDTTSANKEN